jgi:redox-sensing transcriptional repressor
MSSRQPGGIPDIVIGRLPLYLRALNRLRQDGQTVTSSHELGRHLGISSAQIRKDLSHFGGFGKQGTGYQIEYLIERLEQVLQVNREWLVVVIGAGNLGSAITHYRGFVHRGFRIAWVFDTAADKIGTMLGDLRVQPIEEMEPTIRDNHVQIAMLAVPAEYAQSVADKLIAAGIRAILNYAPININVPDGVKVEYIDPVIHMQHMTYYLRPENNTR